MPSPKRCRCWRGLIRSQAFLLLAASLSGCGGGSDAPKNETPGGIWHGTIGGDAVFGIIGEGGATQLMSVSDPPVGFAGTHYAGSLSVLGNEIDDVVRTFLISSIGLGTATVEATVTPRATMAGTVLLSDPGATPKPLLLTYDLVHRRDASLAAISGIWSRTAGTFTIAIAIDALGQLSGSDTNGCQFTGDVSVPNTDFNVYRVHFLVSSCARAGDYDGLATLADVPARNDTLVMASTGFVGVVFIAPVYESLVEVLTRQ